MPGLLQRPDLDAVEQGDGQVARDQLAHEPCLQAAPAVTAVGHPSPKSDSQVSTSSSLHLWLCPAQAHFTIFRGATHGPGRSPLAEAGKGQAGCHWLDAGEAPLHEHCCWEGPASTRLVVCGRGGPQPREHRGCATGQDGPDTVCWQGKPHCQLCPACRTAAGHPTAMRHACWVDDQSSVCEL